MNRVILSILLLGMFGCGIGMGHAIWGHNQNNSAIAPTYALDNNHAPTPTPTPCAGQSERTAYSFCGKVTVNSSAEFDRLLKDIEKHSYHIQMGWMHLDYEYAHKTYDNTLPAPVNICMGVIPSDNFPMGSEWEGRMAYTIDDCAPFGSCDFDTLALIPTPTPTPKEQEP